MPRKGPRRPLFSVRVDEADDTWVRSRAIEEGVDFAAFGRRVLSYARETMPLGWTPTEDEPTPTDGEAPCRTTAT
ncbi:ribbon-helix-helix DNA binding domain protein [Gordonia phage RedWattleHog]|uniref:Ribbon-helix-helix DNA binding domain protein n=1 Tax=Gordonia phage Stormageddon TaxID=2656541 RepID=A0A649VQX7_9CAUD|nr:ribbon-helix-helix DNA binding domain protein [Gordonia phage Stormageddon]QGJ94866.1 ribbon-helix-helix DNA binding domain protein [Gordonia phage Stormageddon]QLF83507.1 ribbon-helix-helix DNA binding domain protein [Gordonia phage RedWattleHog]